jgi:hypothetical protein
MTRWIALVGCALTVALAMPFGNAAEAARLKRCIAPATAGAKMTWVCRAGDRCCYDWLFRRGTCSRTRCL